MPDHTSDLTNRVARRLEAERVSWRNGFDPTAAELNAKFSNAKVRGGSAHRQEIRLLCAAELHRRSVVTVDALLSEHKKMSESPRDDVTASCKDWLANRIAEEAADLQMHLWSPRAAFGETGAGDNLDECCRTESESVFAHVDSYMGQLRRERTERGIRRVTRMLAWIRKALRLP